MSTLTRLMMMVLAAFCLTATATQAIGEETDNDTYYLTTAGAVAMSSGFYFDANRVKVYRNENGVYVGMMVSELNAGTLKKGMDLRAEWFVGMVSFDPDGRLKVQGVVIDQNAVEERVRSILGTSR